jgi:hypothetical protein
MQDVSPPKFCRAAIRGQGRGYTLLRSLVVALVLPRGMSDPAILNSRMIGNISIYHYYFNIKYQAKDFPPDVDFYTVAQGSPEYTIPQHINIKANISPSGLGPHGAQIRQQVRQQMNTINQGMGRGFVDEAVVDKALEQLGVEPAVLGAMVDRARRRVKSGESVSGGFEFPK